MVGINHDVDLDIFITTGNSYTKLPHCSAMTYDYESNEIWVVWDEITLNDSGVIYSAGCNESLFVMLYIDYLSKNFTKYYCKLHDFKRCTQSDLFCSLDARFSILRKDNKMPIFEESYDSYNTKDIVPYNKMFNSNVFGRRTFGNVKIPVMSDIFYNSPYTTVKWVDGTTTTVKAGADDEFNKEYGLAMAIAKKYYECLEAPNPRAAFKKAAYKDAHDQTEKTKEKRAYKEEKKKRNKRNGRISTSKKTSKR